MRVLIAGAGHGGLVAAAMLAGVGHTVTVFEKKERRALGHDWEDRFTFSILADVLGMQAADLPADIWRYRGDCAFVSPSGGTRVVVHYPPEQRQKIMWRKPLLRMLLENAEMCGAQLRFGTTVHSPVTEGTRVAGLVVDGEAVPADLVIDAAGVISPVRANLPPECGIERMPRRGDVFYACRAYFDLHTPFEKPDVPFEVYLRHEGEQGLSWFCTHPDCADVLVGRVDPLTREETDALFARFRASHPWMGETVLHGGQFGVIPVRRPLARMVTDGYAAVGDSAFMTTPMNGMGLDLSMQAGRLLAKTVIETGSADVSSLWQYNRMYHVLYGAETAKNDGLKNALLSMPREGVDFLFESGVIAAGDLSGAGRDMRVGTLLHKFARGMRRPAWFFVVLGGIVRGARSAKLYQAAPKDYSPDAVRQWSERIARSSPAISDRT